MTVTVKAAPPAQTRMSGGGFPPNKEEGIREKEKEEREGRAVFAVGCKRPCDFVPKYPYPKSSEEMYDTLEAMGIETDPDHDGNFFDDMVSRNWTLPTGKPVYDWPKLYEARLQVTGFYWE